MSALLDWPWVVIALLGAWHGLNPGMGWLFAAALGLQEGKGSAAWRALPPLALGHALAVAVAVGAAMGLGLALSPTAVRWAVGSLLIGYGGMRLVRSRHPRGSGMRVGPRDLTVWSFLMASAHGAGLMVLPFFMAGAGGPARGGWDGADLGGASTGTPGAGADALGVPHAHAGHGGHGRLGDVLNAAAEGVPSDGADILTATAGSPELLEAVAAVALHTGAYLLVTGAFAVAVVSWLGLRLLRSLWVDLDRIWAASLVVTGVLALVW